MSRRVILIVGALALTSGPLRAQSDAPAVTMRESVYEKLSEAQEATEAGDTDRALRALRDVEEMRGLEPYERAQLQIAYGYLYFTNERYEDAVAAYRQVLADEQELSAVLVSSSLYTLAQLEFQARDFPRAVEYLERWMARIENPGPEPYVLLAQARYQASGPGEALEPIERAIRIMTGRGQPVKEEWYQLLRAFLHELEEYQRLVPVLETLIREYPAKEYWLHLAGVYGEMGDQRRQLVTYRLAYAQGLLDRAEEIRLLAQLLLQADVPYRAGVVLAQGLADGTVAPSPDDYLLLAQAWTLAREDARAIDALTEAAALTADGEVDARLAQAYANEREWVRAVASGREALDKGVEDEHELHVLIGMSLFELARYDEATQAFREAREAPEGRETASRWIAYIESELARMRDIDRSLR